MTKKILGTALNIVGIGLIAASQLVPGLNVAVDAALIGTGILAGAVGGRLLAADAAAKANQSALVESLNTHVDPLAPAIWCFGETPLPTQIVYAETYNSDKRALQVIGGCFHPVTSFESFLIQGTAVTFGDGSSANTATAPSDWSGVLARAYRLGSETPAALETSGLFSGHDFPSTAKGEGLAWFALAWDLENDKLQGGIPTQITQVVKGMPVYDPRQDSTVGGSGTQRANDQTTWAYGTGTAPAGSNAVLVTLSFMLGWKQNGQLAFGMGKDPSLFDWANVIEQANVCDELVDGIPQFHIGGSIRLDGDNARIIGELEATIGMKVTLSDGLYRFWVPHNDLASPPWTITEDDILRDAGVQYEDARDIQQTYNTARGQYIEPGDGYLPVSYPDVVESTALADAGQERVLQIDFPHLTADSRAQRVARQMLRRSLLGRTWQLAVGPAYLGATVFDVVTLNIRETNDTDQLVRIIGKQTSVTTGAVVLTLEEEDATLYDTSTALVTPPGRNAPPAPEDPRIWAIDGVILSLVITGDDTGQPRYAVAAVAGATAIYLTFTTDGTDPGDPTAAAHDVAVTGRTGEANLGSPLAAGATIKVKAVAENARSALGPVSPIAAWTRPSTADTKPSASVDLSVATETTVTFTADGSIGAGGSAYANLEGRWRKRTAQGAWTAPSSWAALPLSTGAITKDPFYSGQLEVVVRDTGVSGSPQSSPVYAEIPPILQGLNPGDGRLDPTALPHGRIWKPDDLWSFGHLGPTAIGRAYQVLGGFGGVDTAYPRAYVDLMDPTGLYKLIEVATRKIQDNLLAGDGNVLNTKIGKLDGGGDALKTLRIGSSAPLRHLEGPFPLQHTDPQSFDVAFDGVPQFLFIPQVGRTYSQGDASSDQKIDMRAENVDVTGFELRAVQRTATSITAISDGWSSSQNAAAPENGSVPLASTSAAAYCNLEDANAVAVQYAFCFDVDTSDLVAGSSITLHIWRNDGVSSTSWTEIGTITFPAFTVISGQKVYWTGAMGANYDFRATITEDLQPPNLEFYSITMHGEDGSPPGVQYNRDDGSSEITMTPDVGDAIACLALDAS